MRVRFRGTHPRASEAKKYARRRRASGQLGAPDSGSKKSVDVSISLPLVRGSSEAVEGQVLPEADFATQNQIVNPRVLCAPGAELEDDELKRPLPFSGHQYVSSALVTKLITAHRGERCGARIGISFASAAAEQASCFSRSVV
jgi:hypothetical protein